MKAQCIYIFPSAPIFNRNEVKLFYDMDAEHSELLYSALYQNHLDVVKPYMEETDVVCCFDNKDKDLLPKLFYSKEYKLFFNDLTDKPNYFKVLNEKYFSKCRKNIVIFSNSISICLADVQKIFNLLSIEDEVAVLGKSYTNKLAFIGFNSYNSLVSKNVNWDLLDYDETLNVICKHKILVHVLEKYFTVNDVGDFKRLYNELSKKESISYCNDEKHEQFTHLFIEYKDLLK